jgi:phage shock protein A
MFKTIITLFRARAHQAEENFSDFHALTLLDQQIRDCVAALAEAKKACAFAIAQHQAEQRRLATLDSEIADLENRAGEALERRRDDLALEAAGLIADLEADRDASRRACDIYDAECARMRGRLRKSESRLGQLHRGRNLARARDALGRLRRDAPAEDFTRAGFAEAEATLARLNDRTQLAEDADEALAAFDAERSPRKMAEKLAENGCGPRLRPTAEDVLARLRARNAA